MADCIFCKIIEGKIPSTKLGENAGAYAFADINPTAPVHALVIPRQHIASMNEVTDWSTLTPMFELGAQIAREKGLDKSGWRCVINTGPDANQLVFHIHLHVIGGRQLSWPPG
jgi:histidine triad (HIT) family protein